MRHFSPARIARRLYPARRVGHCFDILRLLSESFKVDVQTFAAIKIRQRIDPVAQPFGQRPKRRTVRKHSIRPKHRRRQKTQRDSRDVRRASLKQPCGSVVGIVGVDLRIGPDRPSFGELIEPLLEP